MADCTRILSSQLAEGILFERLRTEQERFAKEVTFTGHTLKTPLQGVLFQLRRLNRYSEGADLPRDEAGRIFTSARKQILRAVFDAQQLQYATRDLRSNVDLEQVLRELCADFREKAEDRGITVRVDIFLTRKAHVFGIESHLRVALSNLLDNAVKYSFADKEVRVSLRLITQRDALIEFSNYGVGISDEHREQLFQYGQRAALNDTKQNRFGSGLGLLQAKQFIESSGGSIHLENRILNDKDPKDIRQVIIVRVTLPC